MRAAWWWIDRWRKSTAYTDMTLAEQGAYRNLLDECWLRGGIIPEDDRILGKISGDAVEWPKVRKNVLARFQKCEGGLSNETAQEIIRKTTSIRDARSAAGKKGNETRWGDRKSIANGVANAVANGSPPSPSPSPSPSVPSYQSRANPLVKDRRPQMETECLRWAREIADLTDQDPTTVMIEAAGYKGATRSKVNPAAMSDDRLANTWNDLKADVEVLRKKHGKKTG